MDLDTVGWRVSSSSFLFRYRLERVLHTNTFLSPKHSLGLAGDTYCKAILTLVKLSFYLHYESQNLYCDPIPLHVLEYNSTHVTSGYRSLSLPSNPPELRHNARDLVLTPSWLKSPNPDSPHTVTLLFLFSDICGTDFPRSINPTLSCKASIRWSNTNSCQSPSLPPDRYYPH